MGGIIGDHPQLFQSYKYLLPSPSKTHSSLVAMRKLYLSACVYEFFDEAWEFLEGFASKR
jgi:hypothetical protein